MAKLALEGKTTNPRIMASVTHLGDATSCSIDNKHGVQLVVIW